MNDYEIRLLDVNLSEKEMVIEGYAVTFNQESETLGGENGFKEIIETRALNNTKLDNVFLLFNHDYDNVLANSDSGTLQLRVTDKGLFYRAVLPNTARGQEIYELVKRGDLKKMSFAFRVKKDKWDFTKQPTLRKIEQIDEISELSIVPRPAYPSTEVIAKRALKQKEKFTDCINCKIDEKTPEALDILNQVKSKNYK